jgi:hypothetical protein
MFGKFKGMFWEPKQKKKFYEHEVENASLPRHYN